MSGVCVGGGGGERGERQSEEGGREGEGFRKRTDRESACVCSWKNFPSGWLGGSAVVLLASGDGTMDEWMGGQMDDDDDG